MSQPNVGILHPGQMGSSVASTIQNSGYPVFWASERRSEQSRDRANQLGLIDVVTLQALSQKCSVLVSVCPPENAEEVTNLVISAGFKGLFIDANAISPARVSRINASMQEAHITFVDGSIIGGPAWKPGETWLYLSGEYAEDAAKYFLAGPLETRIISNKVGRASALKMCFAAYTKGTRALLCSILGVAEKLDILGDLKAQWGADFSNRAVEGAVNVTAKAWRFSGEMDEIAATFREAGQPGGFHEAAAEVYRRLEHFKDADPLPEFEAVLKAIINNRTDA